MKYVEEFIYIKEKLQEFTSRIHPLSPETIELMAGSSKLIDVRKGECFSHQGQLDHHLTFISSGLFRMFHTSNGVEMTVAFARPGDPFMSVTTYLHNKEAEFTMQALEKGQIISIPTDRFKILCRATDLNEWFQAALLNQIYALEQRYVWLSNLDAYSRYAKLIEIRSDIIHRIPLKYIASYLGIKQETLSRIRARYGRSPNP